MRLTCKRSPFLADQTGKNKREGLIHRLRSGESKAFADFIARYQQQVSLCCRTLGLNTAEAEDVASETFMAAYQGVKKYTGKAKLSTWLWKITYNKAISFLRQKIKKQKLQENLQKNYKEETTDTTPDENKEIVWNAVKKTAARPGNGDSSILQAGKKY
ncbi:MAG: hypothetical protein CVV39_07165 [Planctomycetes bacterium HGW-Planctomycetes-1]|nr:MAG: hypothetical protein CVV39_07165 [Planctomycetes bacterium HGW-Planctomycetes-1]